MKLEKNEFTTSSLIEFLTEKYGKKITGEPFTNNDISQYLLRKMIPYRYGGQKISVKKSAGVRVITME